MIQIRRKIEATRVLDDGCIACRLVERGPKDRPVCFIVARELEYVEPGNYIELELEGDTVTYGHGVQRFAINGGQWVAVDDPSLCQEKHQLEEWYTLKFAPAGEVQRGSYGVSVVATE